MPWKGALDIPSLLIFHQQVLPVPPSSSSSPFHLFLWIFFLFSYDLGIDLPQVLAWHSLFTLPGAPKKKLGLFSAVL